MRSYVKRTGLGLAAVVPGLLLVPAARADTSQTVRAGLTITPSVSAVGDTVTVVATATNITDVPVSGALGIDNYADLHTTSVHGHGCAPRNVVRIIYCGLTNLAPGATASITVTVVTSTAGSFDFRSYARGGEDTYAYGTLTAS